MENIAQMYRRGKEKFGDRPAFAFRDSSGAFQAVTYSELYETAENLALALLDLGVKAKEHVGLVADNRLEWIISSMAVGLTGAADVPRGSDVTEGDITYIVPHSGMKVAFVENEEIYKRITKVKRKLPELKKIILIDFKGKKPPKGALGFQELIEKGASLREKNLDKLNKRIDQIKPDHLLTLIYTSGTTGVPKGVMLTHANLVSQVKHIPIDFVPEDRMLSILPIWHIFERVFEMVAIYEGCCTYYTSLRTLREDLGIVKPTFMASAPRLWEKLYNGILLNIEKSPAAKQKMFNAAYTCSKNFNQAVRFLKGLELDIEGRNIAVSAIRAVKEVGAALLFAVPYFLLDAVVLKKVRMATGGQLKGTVSGGGALPTHVDMFFNNIGIPVLEGYGLTETSPVLAVRTFNRLVIGTVGPIYPETDIKIVDIDTGKQIFPGKKGVKGEIHARGPQVMAGYYKNKKATSAVLDGDGFFNTGDIGMITFNNNLKLFGRTKDTIVLMGGENVEPVPIENMMNQSHFIDLCMVVGQDQKTLGALVVPNLAELEKYGKTHAALAKNAEVKKLIKEDIKKLISEENGFKAFEKVVDIHLMSKPFEMGSEVTAKFTLKRHVIMERYQKEINSLYK